MHPCLTGIRVYFILPELFRLIPVYLCVLTLIIKINYTKTPSNPERGSMAIYRYKDAVPQIGEHCYISDSARVIGDVILGEGCYVGHGAIIRADYGKIRIGFGSAIEENAVIHARVGALYSLGKQVTLGHGAIVHGDSLGDFAVVGMGAVVGRQSVIGEWSIVAEGAVVPTGKSVEPGTIVAGIPAVSIGEVTQKHKEYWIWAKKMYRDLARDYKSNLQRLDRKDLI